MMAGELELHASLMRIRTFPVLKRSCHYQFIHSHCVIMIFFGTVYVFSAKIGNKRE